MVKDEQPTDPKDNDASTHEQANMGPLARWSGRNGPGCCRTQIFPNLRPVLLLRPPLSFFLFNLLLPLWRKFHLPAPGPAWVAEVVFLEPSRRPLIPPKRETNRVRPVAHEAGKHYTPLAVRQQGRKRTAADLIKLAMIRIDAALAQRGLQTAMLLQVHDELLFESPPSELDETRALVKSQLENVAKLEVPLTADLSSGPNWRDAK